MLQGATVIIMPNFIYLGSRYKNWLIIHLSSAIMRSPPLPHDQGFCPLFSRNFGEILLTRAPQGVALEASLSH